MRNVLKTAIAVTLAVMVLFGITSTAAVKSNTSKVKYYDSEGNRVYGSNKYYDGEIPMYGRGCYYYDEDGSKVSAYGCRVYYYEGGELSEGHCYYDSYGNEVRPYRNARGRGCCRRY